MKLDFHWVLFICCTTENLLHLFTTDKSLLPEKLINPGIQAPIGFIKSKDGMTLYVSS